MGEKKNWREEFDEFAEKHQSLCVGVTVALVVFIFVVFGVGVATGAIVGIVGLFKALFTWSLVPLLNTLVGAVVATICLGVIVFVADKLEMFDN